MKGFTLIELLVTVTIVAVLAAVAFPSYTTYVERSKLVSATEELTSYAGLMQQYYANERTYLNAAGDCGVTPSSSEHFSIGCTAPSKTSFTLTATSLANTGLGGAGSYVYSIDEDGDQTTGKFKGSAPSDTDGWKLRK